MMRQNTNDSKEQKREKQQNRQRSSNAGGDKRTSGPNHPST